jgi:4-alpha-glucanotransferase
MPLQDVFGWRERVNTPIVSDDNWTWRLPYAVESLIADPEAIERARFVHGLAGASGRLTSKPA